MGYCFIVGCPSKTRLFQLPKVATAETAQVWRRNIPKREIPWNDKKSKLCYLHFDDKYVVKSSVVTLNGVVIASQPRKLWTLTPDAVPTLFSNSKVPKYYDRKVSSRKAPSDRVSTTSSTSVRPGAKKSKLVSNVDSAQPLKACLEGWESSPNTSKITYSAHRELTECANCKLLHQHHDLSSEFVWYNQDLETETEISIKNALWTIFEHAIELNQANSKNLTKDYTITSQIKLCSPCLNAMAELYRCYLEFIQLTKTSSVIQHLIGHCLFWEDQQQQERQPPLTNKSTKVNNRSDQACNDKTSFSLSVPRADSFTSLQENSDEIMMIKDEIKLEEEDLFINKEEPDHDHDDNQCCWENNNEEEEDLLETKKLKPDLTQLKQHPRVMLTRLNSKSSIEIMCSTGSSDPETIKSPSNPTLNTNINTSIEYPCKICLKIFPSPIKLQLHYTTQHNRNKPFTVSERIKFLLKSKKLQIKASTKFRLMPLQEGGLVDRKMYECLECGSMLNSRLSCQKHAKSFHLPKSFVCTECPKSFYAASKLNWHLFVKHGIGERLPDQECSEPGCGRYFSSPSDMKSHFRVVHAAEQLFPCPSCPAKYSSALLLKIHCQKTHGIVSNNKRRLCETCGVCLKNNASYKSHLRLVHGPSNIYTCSICGKTSKYSMFLKRHMQTHNQEQSIHCDQCPKTFYTIGRLKHHMKTKHSNLEKIIYECQPCGGTKYINSISFKRHQILHHSKDESNLVRHDCSICGASFKRKDTLTTHMRSRLHGEPGKNKSERTNTSSRQKHEKRKRSYECQPCGIKYTQANNLQRHNIVHHTDASKILLQTCTICGKSFKLKSLLTAHMQSKTHGGPGFRVSKSRRRKSDKDKSDIDIDVTTTKVYEFQNPPLIDGI